MPGLDDAALRGLAAASARLHAARGADAPARAWIDAVVARGYGLSRSEYAAVLDSFPNMPGLGGGDILLSTFDSISLLYAA
jgi:hypothetical protein